MYSIYIALDCLLFSFHLENSLKGTGDLHCVSQNARYRTHISKCLEDFVVLKVKAPIKIDFKVVPPHGSKSRC